MGRCDVLRSCKKSSEESAMKVESRLIEQRDLEVVMRDGTSLAVDVYRPPEPGKYPVLYASALHNKDIQGPDIADILPPQPAHAPLWFGPLEAGDTRPTFVNWPMAVNPQPPDSGVEERDTDF